MILTDDEIWKNDNIMAANSGYGANFETLRELIRAVESALLEKLRGGVEVPEAFAHAAYKEHPSYEGVGDIVYYHPNAKPANCIDLFTRDQLLAYGAAQRLAGRERAIEEWRVHLLELWEKGNFDLKDAIKETYSALAASPQEQT